MTTAKTGRSGPTSPQTKTQALAALLLLVPAPILGTAAAMWFPATRGTGLGQILYASAKLWLLIFPLFWWRLVEGGALTWSPPRRGGLGMGFGLGLVLALLVLGAYAAAPHAWLDTTRLRQEAVANGIGTPTRYLLLAGYLSFVNALLEEYVWRWFVFRKCEALVGTRMAAFLAGGLFTLHHVLALKVQFGWTVTLLASLGIWTGGVCWSWLYGRYRSIWPAYLSHVLVDLAVFALGWRLLFG